MHYLICSYNRRLSKSFFSLSIALPISLLCLCSCLAFVPISPTSASSLGGDCWCDHTASYGSSWREGGDGRSTTWKRSSGWISCQEVFTTCRSSCRSCTSERAGGEKARWRRLAAFKRLSTTITIIVITITTDIILHIWNGRRKTKYMTSKCVTYSKFGKKMTQSGAITVTSAQDAGCSPSVCCSQRGFWIEQTF